jgi:hypothetical protein
VRLQSVRLLNDLGGSARLAVAAAEPLGADCERLLGPEHPDTKTMRETLGSLKL